MSHHDHKSEKHETQIEREELDQLRKIDRELNESVVLQKENNRLQHEGNRLLRDLIHVLTPVVKYPSTAVITQGANMPVTGTIKGLLPGATDKFFATPTDAAGNPVALPSTVTTPPAFVADDPGVVIVPAADGLSADVTGSPTGVPGTSFDLNWSATFTKADGSSATIAGAAVVPYLQPSVVEPTKAILSQGSPAA